MAGAVGIVFGLCVLSFTLGAALMYVVLRRREDATSPSPSDEPIERTWVEKPALVEPVEDDYDSRPIHRNPVVGLPQLEPVLSVLADPVAEPEAVAEPEPVGESAPVAELEPAAGLEPEPVAEAELDAQPEPVAEAETVGADGYDQDGDSEPPVGEPEAPEPTVAASTDSSALPPPARPQPVEHTTWVEREDFRQRYLRTFEEVRRKAGSN
jgi:hypothetical protein